MTEKIPEDWEVVKLQDIADYINGSAFSPKDWKNIGLPIIRIQNLNDKNAKFNYFEGEIDSRYIIENGDLLFSWSASIGAYIWDRGNAVLNQHIFKVIPNERVDKIYLFYALYLAIEQLSKRVHGSTMKHFKRSELKIEIPLPPFPEQRKIAEVLSTVDEGIRKVDEAIKKTEWLKKGLMQELLSKGIGHSEFKDSEIGRIPMEWEMVSLGDKKYFEVIMGQSPPSHTYNKDNKGLPFLQGKIEFGEIYPSPTIWCSRPVKIAEKDDVLISVRAPVGEVNISPAKICIGRGLSAIRCNSEKANHLFLFYSLKYKAKKMEAISSGSTFKAVRKNDIDNFEIPLPPLPEQRKIAEILSDVDRKIELERKRKSKLERIKKGLMNDLLTGRKRVKI